jgi:hypothetical protein
MGIEMSTQLSMDQGDYIYPREINWVQVIEDIRNATGSYSIICKKMGTGWSTLQRWRTGSEPRFADGSGLLLIHAQHCGQAQTKQRVMEAEV